MATTIKQTEGEPQDYSEVDGVDDFIWQRIEHYIAYRWPERSVEWIVEGPGEWVPPLTPVDIDTVEIWSRALEWEDVTEHAKPAPLGGYWLPGTGPYRFTGTAGDDSEPPEVVVEAAKRLAGYLAAERGKPGVRTESITAGSVSIRTSGHEAADARGMMNSGAADLLRPYRRP